MVGGREVGDLQQRVERALHRGEIAAVAMQQNVGDPGRRPAAVRFLRGVTANQLAHRLRGSHSAKTAARSYCAIRNWRRVGTSPAAEASTVATSA